MAVCVFPVPGFPYMTMLRPSLMKSSASTSGSIICVLIGSSSLLQFLEVLHLWKVGPVYACYLASFAPPGHLLFQQPTQEGQVVLMTEEVCPAALAVAQGKDGHREGHLLVGYAQLDLAPVKLALLAWLIVLLDEYILRPAPLLGLALLDILAQLE